MADYPYIQSLGNLKKFLATIQTAGVPDKVTTKYLESLGFKSKNDRPILSVLKFVGFIDSSGTPGELWKGYRSKNQAKGLLGGALHSAYAGLFKTYPDAYRKDSEAIRNYFSTQSNVGEAALSLMVKTFQTLCELAEFEVEAPTVPVAGEAVADVLTKVVQLPKGATALTVNLNIQLQLPATDDASVYDKFFQAMKDHLLG